MRVLIYAETAWSWNMSILSCSKQEDFIAVNDGSFIVVLSKFLLRNNHFK